MGGDSVTATKMEQLSSEEIAEFREIFNLVDRDGGGSITKVELGELLDTLGIDASPEEVDQMILETDQGNKPENVDAQPHPMFLLC